MRRTSSEEARLVSASKPAAAATSSSSTDLHRDQHSNGSTSSALLRHDAASKHSAAPLYRRSAAGVLSGQVLLVVLSVWSNRQQETAAHTAPGHLPVLPAAQFVALAITATGWSLWTGHRRKRSHAAAVRAHDPPAPGGSATAAAADVMGRAMVNAGAQRKRAWLAGAMLAAGTTLRSVQATRTSPESPRLVDALEVFVVPCLLAMMLVLRPRLLHPQSWASSPSNRTVFTFAGLTFLLAFLLVGTPTRTSSMLLALVRILLEAASVLFVKDGLSGEGSATQFSQHASASAACAALIFLPFTHDFSSNLPSARLSSLASKAFSKLLISTTATTLAFFWVLMSSSSPLTPALAIFPRNLCLLTPHMGRRAGVGVLRSWTQLGLLYLAGTVASVWTNEDTSTVWPTRWRSASRAEEAETFDLESPAPSQPSTPPPLYRSQSDDHESPPHVTRHGRFSALLGLSLVPFVPLLLQMLLAPLSAPDYSRSCAYLPASIRASVCPFAIPWAKPRTVDLVIAYYDEDIERTKEHIANLRASPFVSMRDQRVIIYNKGPRNETMLRSGLNLTASDEVVPLPNLGREGATYLSHILLHYNATASSIMSDWPEPPIAPAHLAIASSHLRNRVLADMTYFFQPHLAWEGIATPRVAKMTERTGFAHFGPLIRSECGHDMRVDIKLPMVAELWSMFRGELCQRKVGQLSGWSAQFAVSKRRILGNPYERYAYVSELLEAPADHWIHDQWGPNDSGGPSNPAFGHAVERSWPFIFGCADAKLVETCPDEESDPDKCHCFDD
ncbi:hypothetical protein JCM10908_007211 [Rhodotorula pacifica]|uniref:uncharacterized protein n=1 Tax=Rhodotorula pacifica TaxID=1495444 RepID=UPI00316CCC9A